MVGRPRVGGWTPRPAPWPTPPPDDPERPRELQLRYLQRARNTVLEKLAGLSEHDLRRPLTPSGTNLLGLVKHLAGVELGYFGECSGRPTGIDLPFDDDASYDQALDMYALPEESSTWVVDLYRRAWSHTDATVRELGTDAPARVPWWGERAETTVGFLLVHVLHETAQHAGHADVLRELVDGTGGRDHDELGDDTWWRAHLARVQAAADAHRSDAHRSDAHRWASLDIACRSRHDVNDQIPDSPEENHACRRPDRWR